MQIDSTVFKVNFLLPLKLCIAPPWQFFQNNFFFLIWDRMFLPRLSLSSHLAFTSLDLWPCCLRLHSRCDYSRVPQGKTQLLFVWHRTHPQLRLPWSHCPRLASSLWQTSLSQSLKFCHHRKELLYLVSQTFVIYHLNPKGLLAERLPVSELSRK